jgi:hypothetical protein
MSPYERQASLWSRRAVVAAALTLVVNVGLLIHFHDRFWWPPDDAWYAHTADRMLHGEVLHRDVLEPHLAIHFLHEAALALFGNRLVSLRYPLAAVAVLGSAGLFVLLLPSGAVVASIGAVSSVALGVLQFLDPTPNWYCDALTVAAALVLTLWPRRRAGRTELLGVLCGLSVLLRQLSGVLLAVGVVLVLLIEDSDEDRSAARCLLARCIALGMAAVLLLYLLRSTDGFGFALLGIWPVLLLLAGAWITRMPDRVVVETMARLLVGSVLAALPLLAYHAAHGSISNLVEDGVIRALTISRFPYLSVASYAQQIATALQQIVQHQTPVLVINGIYWIVLTLAGTFIGAFALRCLVRERTVHPLIVLAVSSGVNSLFNQIPIYLYYSLTLFVPAALLFPSSGRRRFAMTAGAAALSLTAIWYHAAQPLSRGMSGTIAGERIGTVPTEIPRAGLWSDPADGAVYRTILGIIERDTKPGDPIFAFPDDPEFYYLSERRNPFPFFTTAIYVRNAADAEGVIDVLRRARPRIIVFAPEDKNRMPPVEPVVSFVHDHWTLIARAGRFEVYRLGGG